MTHTNYPRSLRIDPQDAPTGQGYAPAEVRPKGPRVVVLRATVPILMHGNQPATLHVRLVRLTKWDCPGGDRLHRVEVRYNTQRRYEPLTGSTGLYSNPWDALAYIAGGGDGRWQACY